MSRWGSFDFNQIKDLQRRLERLQNNDMDAFCKQISNEIAARFLRGVKQKTPVDTGILRNHWMADAVQKSGSNYTVTIYNSMLYAAYVEYGHRTPSHTGWVEGKFMMTLTADQIGKMLPGLIQKRLTEHLKGVFGN